MVKGISKRVVVVQPEDSAVFEQAIFIVRDGERQDIIKEARAVAEQYLRQSSQRVRRYRRRFTGLQMLLSAGGGALLTGLVWAATVLLL